MPKNKMLLCVSALENGDGGRSAEAQALADASRPDTIFCSNKQGRLIPPFSFSVLVFLSPPQSKYSLPRNSQQLNSLQTCFHLQVVVLVDLVTLLSEHLLTSDSLLCLFEFFLY